MEDSDPYKMKDSNKIEDLDPINWKIQILIRVDSDPNKMGIIIRAYQYENAGYCSIALA